MGDIDVVNICEKVLERLAIMDYEKFDDKRIVNKSISLDLNRQLIFPLKIQGKELNQVDRISEQELRQLFIEEFKATNDKLFYSIETPTQEKYKFGKSYEDIIKYQNDHIRSASIDMCVFDNGDIGYNRLLNIEFKHKNTKDKNIAKDVLKLMREKQNGAFILLLNNSRKGDSRGTLWNKKDTGMLDKLHKSCNDFGSHWNGENKYIQLVILSLKQKKLIHRKITKTDLINLDSIFFVKNGCGNIDEIKGNGWGSIAIEGVLESSGFEVVGLINEEG
jgi:ketosteroid isomerase-like protein